MRLFSGSAASPQSAARVLLVDDEETILTLFSHWLEGAGYVALTASSATTALAVVRADRVDVAVVDIQMPGHNGIWLIEQLRRDHSQIGIIIATGLANLPAEIKLQPGVVAYLVKPFEPEDLERAVGLAIQQPMR